MRRVLVTGSTGFIGRYLVAAIHRRGVEVRGCARHIEPASALATEQFAIDLTRPETLRGMASDMDAVFHLAGCADDAAVREQFRRVNEDGTRAVLQAARAAGVGRFVYLSSVKAGERDPGPYGASKAAAERMVLDAADAAMAVTVLRSVPVYGAGMGGNLARLLRAIRSNRCPPPPRVHERRSLVGVRDLCEILWRVATTANTAGQTYVVTDGYEYSLRRIYERSRRALAQPVPGWGVPMSALRVAGRIGDSFHTVTGRAAPFNRATLERMFHDAWYDGGDILRLLGYRPNYTLWDALPEIFDAL